MLTLPPTIRIPVPADFPHREDIADLLQKRKAANITQGFVTRPNKTPLLPFAFTADININNNRLWQLFTALAGQMPANVSCTYGLYEEDPVTTMLLPKELILATLLRFENEVVMDCTLQVGLLYHTKAALQELHITESKYVKFASGDNAKFLQVMAAFQLKQVPGLAFVDEYPKLVLPLRDVVPTARRVQDVLWSLNRAFGME